MEIQHLNICCAETHCCCICSPCAQLYFAHFVTLHFVCQVSLVDGLQMEQFREDTRIEEEKRAAAVAAREEAERRVADLQSAVVQKVLRAQEYTLMLFSEVTVLWRWIACQCFVTQT